MTEVCRRWRSNGWRFVRFWQYSLASHWLIFDAKV